jgi:hypothetical protein
MFEVCDKPCAQCLFSKNRIVSAKRVKEILTDCAQKDTHFQCHKGTIEGKDICCRTFYDTRTSQMIRIAQRLNKVKFVDVNTLESGHAAA